MAGSSSSTFTGELPTPLAGVPDVSLQVGPSMTHFSAHRTVLAAHSGFFKAALTNHTGRFFEVLLGFLSKCFEFFNGIKSASRQVNLT